MGNDYYNSIIHFNYTVNPSCCIIIFLCDEYIKMKQPEYCDRCGHDVDYHNEDGCMCLCRCKQPGLTYEQELNNLKE